MYCFRPSPYTEVLCMSHCLHLGVVMCVYPFVMHVCPCVTQVQYWSKVLEHLLIQGFSLFFYIFYIVEY